MYSLATIYRKGDGAAEDQTEAVQWYQKAARLGHPQAKQELVKLGQTW
jgi:TPR repeat protein